jgi:DNA-binding CsgD family transcriptional regulator
MLGVPLHEAARGGPSFAFSRSGRDFSPRDLDVAAALQTALLALHRRVVVRQQGGRRDPSASPTLTPRERDVLVRLSAGGTAHAVARSLGISTATARKHLEHVYRKLGVQDRLSAVNRGREIGLL